MAVSPEQAIGAEYNKRVNEVRVLGNKGREADKDRSYGTF